MQSALNVYVPKLAVPTVEVAEAMVGKFEGVAGYFDGAAEFKPLLQTWSISVEEQFYVVVPYLLVAISVLFHRRYLALLIPLALRGVRFVAESAAAVLRRNILIYGVGGIIAPFVGIKIIDLLVHNVLGA